MARTSLCFVAGCWTIWCFSASSGAVAASGGELLQQAVALAKKGQATSAKQLFEELIAMAPPPAGAFRNYAVFLFQQQRSPSEAVAVLRRAVDVDDDPVLFMMLMDLLKDKESEKIQLMWRALQGRLSLQPCALCKHDPKLAATTIIKAKQAAIVSKSIAADTLRCCGVEIDLAGFGKEAERVLTKAHTVFPDDFRILEALEVTQYSYYESFTPSTADHARAYKRLTETWKKISHPSIIPTSAVEWSPLVNALPIRPEEDCPAGLRDTRFDKYASCPTVAAADLTPEALMSRYVARSQAVVITGTADVASQWNDVVEQFRASSAGMVVDVAFAAAKEGRLNRMMDIREDLPTFAKVTRQTEAELLQKYKGTKVLIRPAQTHMLAEDFFKLFERELPAGVYPYLHQSDAGHYVNVSSIPKPPAFASILEKRLMWRNVWLSPRGAQTDPHFDQYDNLLMVVNGVKDVLLFPPFAYEDLAYKPAIHFFADGAPAKLINGSSEHPQQPPTDYKSHHLDNGQRPPLDYLKPQGPMADTYKKWTQRHACRAVLDPNSTLFMPAFWTHAVHGMSNPTMSVNYWFQRQLELDGAITLSRKAAQK